MASELHPVACEEQPFGTLVPKVVMRYGSAHSTSASNKN
jgi:hypothetical protein